MFDKKEKIEFYSTNVYSLCSYPIEQFKTDDSEWYQNLKNLMKLKNSEIMQNTFRCPGLFSPFKHGYILRSWYDFKIIPNEHTLNIQYPSPDIFLNTSESINFHEPSMLMEAFKDKIVEGKKCHKLILKINTSWFVKLPKGYQLLQTNIPLTEEKRFSAVTGIYDPLINNQITIPLFWHHLDESTTIKAGTPLCFLLPIKLPDQEVVVREATSREYEWAIFNYRRNNTFVRNYEKMIEVAKKFFNKNY